jgi:hypothetical protein
VYYNTVNTLEDITLDPSRAVDDNEDAMPLIHTAVSVEVAGWLSTLCELRKKHFNDEERASLAKYARNTMKYLTSQGIR